MRRRNRLNYTGWRGYRDDTPMPAWTGNVAAVVAGLILLSCLVSLFGPLIGSLIRWVTQ
jgi:hypothetical protein